MSEYKPPGYYPSVRVTRTSTVPHPLAYQGIVTRHGPRQLKGIAAKVYQFINGEPRDVEVVWEGKLRSTPKDYDQEEFQLIENAAHQEARDEAVRLARLDPSAEGLSV